MTIAEMIKKTRLDNNITQEEYAQKFGVTRQTVSSWENGKSLPDLQLIITICNTYNLSLDALLNEDQIYVKKIAITQKNITYFLYNSIFLFGFSRNLENKCNKAK